MLKQTGQCFENAMGYLVLAIYDEILATRHSCLVQGCGVLFILVKVLLLKTTVSLEHNVFENLELEGENY